MKLECSVLGVPIKGNSKPGKPSKGVVCIGKGKLKSANGQSYQFQVSTAKARNQQPIELSPQNITNFICTHATGGKVTIEFVQPPWRVFISGADPNRLARFIQFLKKIKQGEDPGNLDDVKEVKSTDLQVQTKLIIDKSRTYYSDYAKSFPTTLQTLSITNCDLSRLDVRWFANTRLTTLCLANNRFAEDGLKKLALIRRFVNLQRLDLSSNMISTFPKDIQFPESLVELILSDNKLWNVPAPVCRVCSLVYLDISHNPIRYLPRKFCWPRLKKIIFNDTFISYLPSYFTLMKLDELRCSNRVPPAEELWQFNVRYGSLSMPTLESIAASAVRQYKLNEEILPWTISIDILTKQCCRCLKHKPSFYIIPTLVLRNPLQLAQVVDTLGDVPVLLERCMACTRLPGNF